MGTSNCLGAGHTGKTGQWRRKLFQMKLTIMLAHRGRGKTNYMHKYRIYYGPWGIEVQSSVIRWCDLKLVFIFQLISYLCGVRPLCVVYHITSNGFIDNIYRPHGNAIDICQKGYTFFFRNFMRVEKNTLNFLLSCRLLISAHWTLPGFCNITRPSFGFSSLMAAMVMVLTHQQLLTGSGVYVRMMLVL
jgi:hypothetical protein